QAAGVVETFAQVALGDFEDQLVGAQGSDHGRSPPLRARAQGSKETGRGRMHSLRGTVVEPRSRASHVVWLVASPAPLTAIAPMQVPTRAKVHVAVAFASPVPLAATGPTHVAAGDGK